MSAVGEIHVKIGNKKNSSRRFEGGVVLVAFMVMLWAELSVASGLQIR